MVLSVLYICGMTFPASDSLISPKAGIPVPGTPLRIVFKSAASFMREVTLRMSGPSVPAPSSPWHRAQLPSKIFLPAEMSVGTAGAESAEQWELRDCGGCCIARPGLREGEMAAHAERDKNKGRKPRRPTKPHQHSLTKSPLDFCCFECDLSTQMRSQSTGIRILTSRPTDNVHPHPFRMQRSRQSPRHVGGCLSGCTFGPEGYS